MESTNEVRSGKKALIAIVCVLALCIGGVFAYLTATHTVHNKLTVSSDVDLEVLEPHWIEKDAVDMLPREEVAKDPYVKNKTDIPLYVFADVSVPVKDVRVTGGMTEIPTEIVSWERNDNWTLKDVITKTENGQSVVIYRYMFDEIVAGNSQTNPIFNKIKMCDFEVNNFSAPGEKLNVVVTGYGIQTDAFDNADEAYLAMFDTTPEFAIFSADDNSLRFYNRENVPEVGSQFDGRTVTALYMGYESDQYGANDESSESDAPWYEVRNQIDRVIVVDEGIQPISTAYWFYNFGDVIFDLDNLDTSKTRHFESMFEGCQAQTIDVSHFNTERAMNMDKMFKNTSATVLDVSNFDVHKLKSAAKMFKNSDAVTIDLTNWHTLNLEDVTEMFNGCAHLTTIYDNTTFIVNSVLEGKDVNMFTGCVNLVGGAGTTYSASHVDSAYAHCDTVEDPGYFTYKDVPIHGEPVENPPIIVKGNVDEWGDGEDTSIDL